MATLDGGTATVSALSLASLNDSMTSDARCHSLIRSRWNSKPLAASKHVHAKVIHRLEAWHFEGSASRTSRSSLETAIDQSAAIGTELKRKYLG